MKNPIYTQMYATERRNVMECSVCGSPVSNQDQHNKWHELLPTFSPTFPTQFEEIPFPDNPVMYQAFSFEGETWQYFSEDLIPGMLGWIRVAVSL